ncbi:MAG TPA: hypothetical protein V6C57_21450 [Coleofasciculaceae cyanobacterium]
MVFSGEIGQQVYNQELAIAIPGQIIGMGPYMANPFVNTAGATLATYTITPPATVDASTAYSLSFDGIVVSFTSGGSTTTAQLGQGLLNAIRANPLVNRKADFTLNAGTGVITAIARFYNTAIAITSPSNATTTNDLTIANTVAIGTTSVVPYGRFVGRTTEVPDPISGLSEAKLINSTSGFTVLGVTMKAFAEKIGRGPTAVVGYAPQTTMNVLQDTVGIKGIWVECVETSIVETDSVYIAVGAGNEGKASKTSSGNIDLTARARFITGTQIDPTGKTIVGVSLRPF